MALHHTEPVVLQPKAKHYPKLDIVRLLCAFLVVLIHCLEVPEGHPIAQAIVTCLAGQAVPYFFILSGFFFAKKLYKSEQPMRDTLKSVKAYLLIYLAWMVIELPSMINTYINKFSGQSIFYICAVIIRRIVFAGQGVYWYILVLAEAFLITGLLIKYKKEVLLYIFAGIGLVLWYIYAINIRYSIFSTIHDLFYTVFSWQNNVIMMGLPSVTIGVFLSRRKNLENLNQRVLIMIYALFTLMLFVIFALSYQKAPNTIEFFFRNPIQATLLFLIAIQPSKFHINRVFSDHCRDISATIYFVHTIIIYQLIDRIWGTNSPMLPRFLIATVLSIVIYFIAILINFKPLSWMLSIKHKKAKQ